MAKSRKAGSAAALARNSYGKSRVRLVKVSRRGRVHTVHELSVDVALRGDFGAIHTRGDNRKCLPTDTMKNTVYALSKGHPLTSIESFALDLADHFVDRHGCVERAMVTVRGVPWVRARVGGRDHGHTFLKGTEERQVCRVSGDRKGVEVEGGIEGLVILKSTDSAFTGYIKDEYTTLKETEDRIFATSVRAEWSYAAKNVARIDFNKCRAAVRTAMIETFAGHRSRSVQHTLYAMGEAALGACRSIDSISLSLPNKHCLLVDLTPFGMTNENEVFVPTDEPHGLIEATIVRR